jgi:hypothetical protein
VEGLWQDRRDINPQKPEMMLVKADEQNCFLQKIKHGIIKKTDYQTSSCL